MMGGDCHTTASTRNRGKDDKIEIGMMLNLRDSDMYISSAYRHIAMFPTRRTSGQPITDRGVVSVVL